MRTIGDLLTALLAVPTELHGEPVSIWHLDHAWQGEMVAASFYSGDEPPGGANPFIIEYTELKEG